VEILPSGLKSRVRGLHSHGKPIQTAYAGQRVAINLQGIEKEEIKRGDSVVIPGRFVPTMFTDAKVELLSDAPVLKRKGLVHFHLGTSETVARVVLYEKDELKPGESAYCQFRLQDPVIALSGDRYIIRRFSPVITIGGGEVLDPIPPRKKRKEVIEDLKIFEKGDLSEKISKKVLQSGLHGISPMAVEGWIKAETPSIKDALEKLKKEGLLLSVEDLLIHRSVFDSLKQKILHSLQDFHARNPLKPGMPKEELRAAVRMESRLFDGLITAINEIVTEKELLRLKAFSMAVSREEEQLKKKILDILEKSGYQPPSKDELSQSFKLDQKHLSDILKLMVKEESLVRINDSLYLAASAYKKMIERLKGFFGKKQEMTVAEFRDVLGTSRKYAVPFLEYLDSNKITLRVGDVRKFLLK
ncbi:MAG: hypothetical protein FJ243_03895, partial [Nitrospira sp.]|nr:hypothetical protein [Nitrospira sp.]